MLYRFWLLTSCLWAAVMLSLNIYEMANFQFHQAGAHELAWLLVCVSLYPAATLFAYKAIRWMIEGHWRFRSPL